MVGAGYNGAVPTDRYISKVSASPLTTGTIFTWTGGISIVKLVGTVTTVIQGQATTVVLSAVADSLASVDIAASKDINAFAAGSLLTCNSTLAGAIVGLTGVAVKLATQTWPTDIMAITSGIIVVTYGAASTGAIRWDLTWRPMTANATVT